MRWGALMLVLFTIPATVMFHNFWAADAAQYQNQLNHFLKNASMIGGLLYMMAFGAGPLTWPILRPRLARSHTASTHTGRTARSKAAGRRARSCRVSRL